MDYYLNELSLLPVTDRFTANKLMQEFVELCSTLKGFGLKILRLSDNIDLKTFKLCEGYYVYDWLKYPDPPVDATLRTKFRSLVTKKPLISLDDEQLSDIFNLSEFVLCDRVDDTSNIQPKGLGMSLIANSIAVSLLNSEFWDQSTVRLSRLTLSEKGMETKFESTRHASQINHIDRHLPWLSELKSGWKPCTQFFPRRGFADQIIVADYETWNNYRSYCQGLSVEDRIASYKYIAEKVAFRHGYVKNARVSSLNDRPVFSAGEGSDCIYLALDKESGTFEVCNYSGRHLGEYSFSGIQVDPADKIERKHDLYV